MAAPGARSSRAVPSALVGLLVLMALGGAALGVAQQPSAATVSLQNAVATTLLSPSFIMVSHSHTRGFPPSSSRLVTDGLGRWQDELAACLTLVGDGSDLYVPLNASLGGGWVAYAPLDCGQGQRYRCTTAAASFDPLSRLQALAGAPVDEPRPGVFVLHTSYGRYPVVMKTTVAGGRIVSITTVSHHGPLPFSARTTFTRYGSAPPVRVPPARAVVNSCP